MQENQTKLSVGHGGAALKHVTFEAGAKKMSEKLKNGTAESFFANAADPLHAAFEAKAVIHSGPGGMPLMGKEARDYLEAAKWQGACLFACAFLRNALPLLHVLSEPLQQRGFFGFCP